MPSEEGPNSVQFTAKAAMHEIWADICADCGPDDYAAIVADVSKMQRYLRKTVATEPGALPILAEGKLETFPNRCTLSE